MRAVTTRRTLSKSYVPKERVINGPRYCLRSRPLQYCSCHLQRTSHLRKVVKEQRVFGAAGGLRSGGGVRDNGVPEGVDVAQVEQRREPLQLARLSGLANTKEKVAYSRVSNVVDAILSKCAPAVYARAPAAARRVERRPPGS